MEGNAKSLSWVDVSSTLLAILGAVVVFAKNQSYHWWLIGSWRGALAVLGIIGLVMLVVNMRDLLRTDNLMIWGESLLWAAAGVLVIIGLFAGSTTHALFYAVAILLVFAWVALLVRHIWGSANNPSAYAAT